jgi:hypothetical protein
VDIPRVEAPTLDADFRISRWGRNRPFELLLAI